MVFKIGVAIQKKVFTVHAQTKFSKNFGAYRKMCIYIPSICKNKIDLFQKNPAEKCSVP